VIFGGAPFQIRGNSVEAAKIFGSVRIALAGYEIRFAYDRVFYQLAGKRPTRGCGGTLAGSSPVLGSFGRVTPYTESSALVFM
jgi:hypothetical protein